MGWGVGSQRGGGYDAGTMGDGTQRRWVAAALACGFMLRMWFVLRHAHVAGDALVYGDIARNWLEHGVYGFTNTVNGVVTAPRPTLIRLPGYPMFLAACFRVFGMERYFAVLLVQVAVDLWTCLLLGGVARRLWGERAGLAAVWLAAVCPFTANYTAAPLTEVLTLWCVAVAFYGLVRWSGGMDRWVLVLGGAMGFAILLRPEQGLLAAAVVPGMIWMVWAGAKAPLLVGEAFVGLKPHANPVGQRREANPVGQGRRANPVGQRRQANPVGLRLHGYPAGQRLQAHSIGLKGQADPDDWFRRLWPVVVVCLLTVLPLGPWAVRNWRTFHVVQPLAPRQANDPGEVVPYGFQRWYRTWAVEFASTDDVYWNYDGSPIAIEDLPVRAFDTQAQYDATDALLRDYNENNVATPALDARFAALAEERVKASGLRYYVALPVARVVDMALRPRGEMLPMPLEWWEYRQHPWKTVVAGLYAGLNLGYFVLAFVALKNPHLRREMWGTRRGVMVWVMVATVGLRCLLLLTVDNSEMRYTLEFFPVLVVLGAGVFGSGLQPSIASGERLT